MDEVGAAKPATLIERMIASGISEDRARGHIERGAVRVEGEATTDPSASAPWPKPWSIGTV